MGQNDFTSSDCQRALLSLGFTDKTKRRGKHLKFVPPQSIKETIQGGQPPFIMIPKSRKIHCQDEIIKELRKMGGDELVNQFIEKL